MTVSASSRRDSAALPLAAKRHPLIAEVERAMRLRCGFDVDARIVVGVSGGPDSLALLVACAALRSRRGAAPGFEPIAVHVNHHLRPSADDDALHVVETCRHLKVRCEVRDVLPSELPGNVSANARALRYQALADAAESCGAGVVAAAHHAEDQLETILAALCRGSGLDGASAMRWSRPLEGNVRLIRPLLRATKADCMSLCEAARIEWRDDPTNEDASFARARLRHDVLPVLEELWPGAAQRAAATADVLAVAAAALEEKLSAVFGAPSCREWDRGKLADYPAALLAAGLRRAALHAGEAADNLLQRQLLTAAEAIMHDDRRPRAFELGQQRLHVTARFVRLESVARAPRPRA